MKNIDTLVFDIDGTLISDQKIIIEQNIDVIKRLVAGRNMSVVLASARMPKSMARIADQLGVECAHVSFDGCLVWSGSTDEKIVYQSHPIEKSVANDIAEIALSSACTTSVFTQEKWLAENMDYWIGREVRGNKFEPDNMGSDVIRCTLQNNNCFKIMARGNEQDINELRMAIQFNNIHTIKAHSNKPTILEISSVQANKGNALIVLSKKIKTSPERMIVFGDGENDIEMMRTFKWSVAMGNASAKVKEEAKFVIGDNNEASIANFLLQKFL